MKQYLLSVYFKIVLLLFIAGSLWACRSRSADSPIPVINVEEGVQQPSDAKLSDLCTSISYIPLQTDSASLIGEFPVFQQMGESFYCADRMGNHCKVFDKQGNFVRNVGNKGRSNNEFLSIRQMCAEPDLSCISICDYQKIIRYNTSGEVVKMIPLIQALSGDYRIEDMSYAGMGRYCFALYSYKESKRLFSFIDDSGVEQFRYEEPKLHRATDQTATIQGGNTITLKWVDPAFISVFEGNLRVLSANTDTLFSFSPKLEKIPAFIASFGQYKMNEEASNGDQAIKWLGSMKESSGQLFFSLVFPKGKYPHINPDNSVGNAFYDKKTGKVNVLTYDPVSKISGLPNDLDNGIPFWPLATDDTHLYQLVSAMKFINLSESCGSAAMKETAAKLTENSNPVLMVAKLK